MLENDDEMFMKTEVKEQGRSPSQKRTWDKNDKQRSDGRRGDQKKTKNEQFGRMEYPRCETCRKKHLGECYRKISASFKYGKEAHILRNYPNLGNATQKVKRDQLTQGCVYAVTVHDAAASPSTLVALLTIQKQILKHLEDLEIMVVKNEDHAFITTLSVKPTLAERIKRKQFDDPLFLKIRDEIRIGKGPEFSIR
ncbi:hypothetical protein FEM48_Zijuj04G0099400 [Ziziphus jujuba var. spinosa]|uniref:Uncharacterized protein n=1 Tax=Ziziphus jujuba var. spinosa TaxID=714518 RepID=A0A978VJ77_ZIZJJ|nr:hypothetical protein FEM48_Zijuj04G0099400 [Ziziphus jujuba var. spinosa]